MEKSNNSGLESFKKKASGLAGEGKKKTEDIFRQVEGWARENTGEARQKLIETAKKYGVGADDSMDTGQIKNKIKEKLRKIF